MCICGKDYNYKTIKCDLCSVTHHIPCVIEDIVHQKIFISKYDNKTKDHKQLSPDYKNAYKCFNPGCNGFLSPMNAIPFKDFDEYYQSNHGSGNYIDYYRHPDKSLLHFITSVSTIIFLIGFILCYIYYTNNTNSIYGQINDLLYNITNETYNYNQDIYVGPVIFNSIACIFYVVYMMTYFICINLDDICTFVVNIIPWIWIGTTSLTFVTFSYKLVDIQQYIEHLEYLNLSEYNTTNGQDFIVQHIKEEADFVNILWKYMFCCFNFWIEIFLILCVLFMCGIFIIFSISLVMDSCKIKKKSNPV